MEHFRYLYVLLRSIAVSKRPSWHAGEAPHVLTLRPTGDWGCCLAGSLSRRKVKPEQFSLQWQGNFLFVFLKCRACIFQKHISSWIHLRIFLFWCQNSEFLGWEERKKGVCVCGGGISNRNPDGLNCSCCLRYSASCNLYGQLPARHPIHTWLLKVQAKGTAGLGQEKVCQGRKTSSSAELLLSLRDSVKK